MTLLNLDFQKWVGFNDVKSTPTYFHVSRAIAYNQTITPIPFTRVVLNQGGAMNKETGKFTAPVAGIYHFYFTGTVFLPVASASFRPDFTMCLFKNSNRETRRNQHRGSTWKDFLAIDYLFKTGRSNLAGHWQEKVARGLSSRWRSNQFQRFPDWRRLFTIAKHRPVNSIENPTDIHDTILHVIITGNERINRKERPWN